jgi:hypothetical protein
MYKIPTVWGFSEEMQPAGETGSIRLLAEFPRNKQAESLRAVRVESRPWFIIIWEKLTDGNVPGPPNTKPYCCYIRTVFFYKQPYQVDKGKQTYQHWAQVESTLRCDDVVEFDGERFEVGTGMIVWHNGEWWSREWARRSLLPGIIATDVARF